MKGCQLNNTQYRSFRPLQVFIDLYYYSCHTYLDRQSTQQQSLLKLFSQQDNILSYFFPSSFLALASHLPKCFYEVELLAVRILLNNRPTHLHLIEFNWSLLFYICFVLRSVERYVNKCPGIIKLLLWLFKK